MTYDCMVKTTLLFLQLHSLLNYPMSHDSSHNAGYFVYYNNMSLHDVVLLQSISKVVVGVYACMGFYYLPQLCTRYVTYS